MAKFDVYDLNMKKVSEIDLNDEVFAVRPNTHLLYEAVKMQQTNRRAGTLGVKNSSLVSGGGKKPWRQKGTGRARQGSSRASHWVGGGKAMGPKARDYHYRPPRSVRRAAIATALSMRASENAIVILSEFASDGRSKTAVNVLTESLKLSSALVVDLRSNVELHRAVRNLATFDILPPEGLNVESLLNRRSLVLTVAAAKSLDESLRRARAGGKTMKEG
jgi:large subunit ribosomal protein L4